MVFFISFAGFSTSWVQGSSMPRLLCSHLAAFNTSSRVAAFPACWILNYFVLLGLGLPGLPGWTIGLEPWSFGSGLWDGPGLDGCIFWIVFATRSCL